LRPALPTNHKQAVREVTFQLKSLARVPDSWIDCIRKRSETVIEIQPRLAECVSTIGELHHNATEDNVDPSSAGDQQQGRQSAPPAIATVPLSISSARRDTFAVGVQLASKSLGCVGEAFLLGAEFLTIRKGQEQVFTVCFSPMSGMVFVRFPGGEGLAAQGLPDLIAAADATEVASLEMGSIEAFMFVSTSGSMSFGRRRIAGGERGDMEWTGEVPADFLPPSPIKKYASLTFQVDKLPETAQISITWVGQVLPISAALPMPRDEFDSIWRSHDW